MGIHGLIDMDISGEAAETQGIANAVWTDAVPVLTGGIETIKSINRDKG